MRALLVAALIAAGAPAALAGPEPSIEEAIARAAASHQPLVLEFHAAWCGPCKFFEEEVLPAPAVQRALREVTFVRYDLDSSAGERAARRYGVTSVPTFLVIDRTGGMAADVHGLMRGGGPALVAWFVAWLGAARTVDPLAALEDAARDRPDDLAAQLALADRYRAMERRADALGVYHAIAFAPTHDAAGRAAAAAATAAYDALIASEARLDVAVEAAVRFVERFPEAPQASAQLALVIESERVPRPALVALLAKHRDATPDLVAAVRLALLAGQPDEAGELVVRRLHDAPGDRTARLLAAEIEADAGHARRAAAAIAGVCTDPPAAIQLHCHLLESGLATGRRSPGVMHVRAAAARTLAELDHPGATALVQLSDLDDATFGNAAAGLLRRAGRACARGTAGRAVMVELALADGGAASLVGAYGDDGALEACLRGAIDGRVLPAPPPRLEHRLLEYVYVPAATGDAPRLDDGVTEPFHRDAPVGRGALVHALYRTGVRTTVGAGATGIADLGSVAGLRVLGAAELEGGVDTAGHGVYAARALAGIGLPLDARHAVLSVLIGAGAGATSATAIELPAEARLELDVGGARAHLWSRLSYLVSDSPRRSSTGGVALDADEAAVGAGLSVRAGRGRLFFGVGVAVDDAGAGTSATALVGLPIGRWF